MKTCKKILLIFLIVLLFLSFKNISFGNDSVLEEENYSKEYQEYLKLSDKEKAKLNVVPRKYDVPFDVLYKDEETNVIKGAIKKLKGLIGVKEEDEIPRSFILRSEDTDNNGIVDENDLELETYGNINIPIKNQGQYGLCWDFASVRSLETNLALHGYGNYDFSEWHVAFIEKNGFANVIDAYSGGNFENFIDYMINNYGPVFEDEVPYGTQYLEEQFEYLYNLKGKAYLETSIDFPTLYKNNGNVYDSNNNILSEDDLNLFRNSVKKHIMENGSVYISIDSNRIKYLNGYATIYNTANTMDHAISIIGWDDDFSRENFRDKNGRMPSENGAYIALNSWGWNDIIFISYEDYTVESNMSGIVNATTNLEEAAKVIQFQDRNLYNSIKKELKKSVAAYNDDALEIVCVNTNLITSLNLSNKQIENISGLDEFSSLITLDLSNNNITDIHNLKHLNNLIVLNVSNNNIQNVSALSSFNAIQQLNLANNNISDISCLINVSIDMLDLSENPIETDISQLVNIHGIGLNNCNLDNSIIEILSELQNLQQISLRDNNITDVESLKQLPNLQFLDLSGNKNINVNTLPYITLQSNENNNKGGEGQLYPFKLVLQNCNLTDITFLQGFLGSRLDLSDNPISDISILRNIDATYISLRNTAITDVSDLRYKTTLDLSGNKNLEGLENLERVFELTLNDCDLEDISFVSNLNSLCRLFIKNNNISDISPFLQHVSLFYVDISGNTSDSLDIANLADTRYKTLIGNDMKINKQIDALCNCENEITDKLIQYVYEKRYENGYGDKASFETKNCRIDTQTNKIIVEPTAIGEDTATIAINGGMFDGTTYTINYNAKEILELQDLVLFQQPKQLVYVAGDSFNTEGLIIKEIYQNSVETKTQDYTVVDGDNLQEGQEKVTIASNKNPEITIEVDVIVYAQDQIVTVRFPDNNLYNAIKNNTYVEKPYNMIISYNDETNETILKRNMVENLTIMDLTNKNISNIEGLEYFINLGYVYLGRNPNLESIESLNSLNQLHNVQLFETNVNDIGGLLQKETLTYINISKTSQEIIGTNLDEYILPTPIYQSLTMQEDVVAEANIYFEISYDEENGIYYCTNPNHKITVPIEINEEQQNATIKLNKNISEQMPVGRRKIEIIIHGGKTGGSEYTTFYNVEKEFSSLRIYEGPIKSRYLPGEDFQREGMIVAAVYSDGSRREIDDYTVLDGEDLKIGQETVTISYTEDGITKTDTQEIKVYSQEELITVRFPDDNLYNVIKNNQYTEIPYDMVLSHNDENNELVLDKDKAESITLMDLTNKNISNIEGLEYFTNLESLYLGRNSHLETVECLQNLNKLINVQLYETNVSDIGFLLQKETINWVNISKTCHESIGTNLEEFVLPNQMYQALTMQEGVTAEASIYYDIVYDEENDMYICTNPEHKISVPIVLDNEQQKATITLDKNIDEEKMAGIRGIWIMIHGGKTGGSEYTTYYNVEKELSGLRINKRPNKRYYIPGNDFEREGMIVAAVYSDGSLREIDDYIVLDGENLQSGQETVTLSYTEDGVTKTTKQNIKVFISLVEEIFNNDSTSFVNSGGNILIDPNTLISKFTPEIKKDYQAQVIKDNEIITEGKIGTGMEVVIKNNEEEIERFTVIVKGDCNGDGMADAKDMVKINNYRLYGTTEKFDEVYRKAADVNEDEKIDLKDMVRINNYRLYGTEF